MTRFIIQFWPIFLPILIFIIWRLNHRKKLKSDDDNMSAKEVRMWLVAVAASIGIAIISIVLMMFFSQSNTDIEYNPPSYQGGQIIPGKIIPKNNNGE